MRFQEARSAKGAQLPSQLSSSEDIISFLPPWFNHKLFWWCVASEPVTNRSPSGLGDKETGRGTFPHLRYWITTTRWPYSTTSGTLRANILVLSSLVTAAYQCLAFLCIKEIIVNWNVAGYQSVCPLKQNTGHALTHCRAADCHVTCCAWPFHSQVEEHDPANRSSVWKYLVLPTCGILGGGNIFE